MKWNNKKGIIGILVLILVLGFIYLPVKADSGWDSDYDSGWDSSWDSGSDWGSDYDYDWGSDYDYGSSSSSSSGGSGGSFVIFICSILWVIFIVVITSRRNVKTVYNGNKRIYVYGDNKKASGLDAMYNEVSLERIALVDPNLNPVEFKSNAFSIYRDIQTAWMNFDTNTIRKLTTDEIYNMYSSQLETLKLKKQKNIMKDITLEDVKIININKSNDIITVNVFLRVKCYDYVINEVTSKVVRGDDKHKLVIDYVLSFVKSSVNNNSEEKCPNCGAPVKINSSSTCPYCDSTLVKDSSDYVMSKKTCVGQKFDR